MKYLAVGFIAFIIAISVGYHFALYAEESETQASLSPSFFSESSQVKDANPDTEASSGKSNRENETSDTGFRIVVNLASRRLALYENGIRTRLYPVAVGKEWTPTPTGHFIVEEKQEDPAWASPRNEEFVLPPGEDNPLGTRWMGIGGYYGIHGTNAPWAIGDYISNGCIRMYDEDAQELFSIVPTGTPVEIIYQRIVADRQADGTINLYCYPDGYEWQDVGKKDALEALQPYGVLDFVNSEAIAAHIEASEGTPLFIAKSFPVWSEGINLGFFAVQANGDIYLPAVPLFAAFQTKWEWNAEKQEIVAKHRTVPGVQQGSSIYLTADQLENALRLNGNVNDAGQFEVTDWKKKVEVRK